MCVCGGGETQMLKPHDTNFRWATLGQLLNLPMPLSSILKIKIPSRYGVHVTEMSGLLDCYPAA